MSEEKNNQLSDNELDHVAGGAGLDTMHTGGVNQSLIGLLKPASITDGTSNTADGSVKPQDFTLSK